MDAESPRQNIDGATSRRWADEWAYEAVRLRPAPGTPARDPQRRGRPAFEEPPQQVAFAPTARLDLRLDPDGEAYYGFAPTWRQKLKLPACRLVWIGGVAESAVDSHTPYVEALVSPLTDTLSPNLLEICTLPITVLRLLSVGRVLREEPDSNGRVPDAGYIHGGPTDERRFLGNEWLVDVRFEPSKIAVKAAAELPDLDVRTLADQPSFADPPLCVVTDPARRRLLIVPCWEILRVYYASAPLVARQIFQFPRWRAGTLDHLASVFDGHAFRGHAQRGSTGNAYAAAQLQRIGCDAAVSYATTGRAQIRAIPPFIGPATLRCVAHPLALGGCEALFVQQIVDSQPPVGEGSAGIDWWPIPVRPRFRSDEEVAAWWAAFRSGSVPDIAHKSTHTWSEFATRTNAQVEAETLRTGGLLLLKGALERVLRAAPAPAAT
jgi:hypothetical protein